jgi:hypothetical protein
MDTEAATVRPTYVVRVWLPDRPGALAQVAGRIGSVKADVVGIEILERGGGSAIDELTVSLPDESLVDLLVAEIRQVEGVAVEDIRPVAADRPEGAIAALAAVEQVAAAPEARRVEAACEALKELVDADWTVALELPGGTARGSCGDIPDLAWLAAFVNGSLHLGNGHEATHTPGDVAWTALQHGAVVIACGRADRVFHARERTEIHAIGRIVDELIK